ncbi:hypothetical protein WBU96_28395 [Bacillus albus]|uniref:hypothetical protein n=1 Tax=Bacillus albus TaxID=2026189 RepID=UPI0030143C59
MELNVQIDNKKPNVGDVVVVMWGKTTESYILSNHGCSLQYHLANLHGGSTAFSAPNIDSLMKEIREHPTVTNYQVFPSDEYVLMLEPKTKEGAK